MLVLCYGIPKSGSTLGFELVRGVLMDAGYPQDPLSGPNLMAKNFLYGTQGHPEAFEAAIRQLLETIGPDRKVAVKTHEAAPVALFPWLEALQTEGQLQVIASYRDPRDICLSLLDAGARARSKGRKPFSTFKTLDQAARSTAKRIEQFRIWGALQNSLRLYYDTAAFAPDEAISAIESILHLNCDHNAVKAHAFDRSPTQMNKGIQHRYKSELTEEQQQALAGLFSEFLARVCEQRDEAWYAECRARLLEKSVTETPGEASRDRRNARRDRQRGKRRQLRKKAAALTEPA
ncbi:MAG: hypothetical protein JO056_00550 [Alphaproteobacteria bacterium]|nr:hypothetical protein [Alphaproteobacteria bacterium]